MQQTIVSVRGRIKTFLWQNPVMCGIFFFLLFAGIAAGVNSISMVSDTYAVDGVRRIPEALHASGTSWIYCVLMSLCLHGMIAVMLYFSGIWLPAAVLWPIAILLRGMMAGMALGLIMQSWPSGAAFWLFMLLLIEMAFLLPVLLRLASISKNQLAVVLRRLLPNTAPKPRPTENHTPLFMRLCVGLMPCIILESIATPLILYIFCV